MQYLTLNDKFINIVTFMSNNGYKQLSICNKRHFQKPNIIQIWPLWIRLKCSWNYFDSDWNGDLL